MYNRKVRLLLIILPFLAVVSILAIHADDPPSSPASPAFDCKYRPASYWLGKLRSAIDRGEIPDPQSRPLPFVAPRVSLPEELAELPCLTREQIFPFEDSDRLLLTNFSDGQLINLMTDAANTLLATHGDNFDFVGFWVNFNPHHTIGAAFYLSIENDVLGIGSSIFNSRPAMGLAGDNIEGYIMMWNVNSSFWQPGVGPSADFTRLALAQEFEHRWAMFLPDTADGRALQGNNANCGRGAHWNWKVDGQGSGMEIAEWVGSAPAVPEATFISFNTDIGGIFSYADLYLMGYVSPAEMDAGNSELRYMDDSNCESNFRPWWIRSHPRTGGPSDSPPPSCRLAARWASSLSVL